MTGAGRQPELRGEPPYPYETMAQLQARLGRGKLGLAGLMLANEAALTGAAEEDILAGLDRLGQVMLAAVDRGLSREGVLPGPIGLARKAARLHAQAAQIDDPLKKGLLEMNAAALAAAEENAAGGLVVTAPTLGASGVIPALLHFLDKRGQADRPALGRGLLAAGAVGFLIKHNASIAGAEVGCQGEIGGGGRPWVRPCWPWSMAATR